MYTYRAITSIDKHVESPENLTYANVVTEKITTTLLLDESQISITLPKVLKSPQIKPTKDVYQLIFLVDTVVAMWSAG